jgi:transcriptional regulator GlxA family with amidase domain
VLQRIPSIDVTFVGHQRGEVRTENGMLGITAAADLIKGLTATTHWACYSELEALGAVPTSERVVEHPDQRIITAAGVSSGIDMALRLVELLVDRTAAPAAQLMIDYDPQPPFDGGARHKSTDAIMTRVIEYAQLRQ